MLSLALPDRVFLGSAPTAVRKSFDGLSAVVRGHLASDPLAGDLFVFRNRREDRLKLRYWDEGGLAVWAKWLEEGTFPFPDPAGGGTGIEVRATDLALITFVGAPLPGSNRAYVSTPVWSFVQVGLPNASATTTTVFSATRPAASRTHTYCPSCSSSRSVWCRRTRTGRTG